MPIDILFGLVMVGLLFLAVLSVAAIVEAVIEYFPQADVIQVVDPEASRELERIAASKGSSSRKHKRFAYDKKSKKAVLVEGNKIAPELQGEELVEIALT